ncbi:hypothetical protein [Rhodococcus tukisamuensis]|uniref:Hippurate hydrolase n=1 Tax=Rhodococcus tukisamuensis TaxID=168276 RepID=A0A1G7A4E5_9NOCA|nr:hypothetical protein [Rhodococcus tukisamuensis]SDE08756.1 hypothetical protein SAMN05444580_1103 [Rhodococcus tukisamuensis]
MAGLTAAIRLRRVEIDMGDLDPAVSQVLSGFAEAAADLESLYRYLHAHPELSHQEHATAAIVAERLAASGYQAFLCPGTAMAAAQSLQVRMFGHGGHGSMPDQCVDPVEMGAATVMRLQTLVSREISPASPAVVTVGAFRAGDQGERDP